MSALDRAEQLERSAVADQASAEEISAARRIYAAPSGDDIEIDDDARRSDSGDGSGCWVSAWVWVRNEELTPCKTT